MLRGFTLFVLAMLAPATLRAEEDRDFAYTEPCTLFSQDEAGMALRRPTTESRQWVSVLIFGPQADFNCNFKDYLPNARGETAEFDVRGVFSPRKRFVINESNVEIAGWSGQASWRFIESSDGSMTPARQSYGRLVVVTTNAEFVVTISAMSDNEKALNDAKALAALVLTKLKR